jgi:hypothetical protein
MGLPNAGGHQMDVCGGMCDMQTMAMRKSTVRIAPDGGNFGKYFATIMYLFLASAVSVSLPPARGSGLDTRLAPAWRDDADGFILRSPGNSVVYPRKGNDIVSFTYAPLRWGLIVHQSFFAKPVSLSKIVDESLAADRQDYKHVRLLVRRKITVSGHKAMLFTIRFQAVSDKHPVSIMRQQVLIQRHPNEIFLLTFFSPGDLHTGATDMFARIIKSFQFINTRAEAKLRLAAARRAKKWLRSISAGKLLKAIHPGTRIFQIKAYGRPLGYLAVQTFSGKRDGLYGVFCSVNSRVFLKNGTDIFHKETAFWAFTHQPGAKGPPTHFSQWTDSVETMIPFNNPVIAELHAQKIVVDPKTRKPKLIKLHPPYPNYDTHWVTEVGQATTGFFPILDSHGRPTNGFVYRTHVKVVRTLSHIVAGMPNRPVRFVLRSDMPAFMPPVLKLLWPHMVNLAKCKPLAMVAFNNQARRPALRVLYVQSSAVINVHGRQVRAYLVTDQMDPYESKMWVTAHGHLLKYIAGDGSEWTPTTVAAMAKLWHTRLKELTAPLIR